MMPRRQWKAVAFVVVLASAPARAVLAQTGDNVLVVANGASPVSVEIAEYYARARAVPSAQVLRLQLPVTEQIQRAEFEAKIERPLADWLTTHAAQDRILYLVLTKDVPLRVVGTGGQNGTVASVDSELTLLYRKLCRLPVPVAGSIPNPYFLGDAPVARALPFTHERHDIYLVTRLDGYTVGDVKGLVDRAVAPSRDGVVLLDGKAEVSKSAGNTWLEKASANLAALGGWRDRVVLDTGPTVLREKSDVFGYYSWGSNDFFMTERHLGLQFVPGALAAMFVSSDARTFKEPPADWKTRGTPFGGSPQSVAGDLIRDGVTGVAGHVAEPLLNATIRPDILFPAYASGLNLAEAFYLAMPFLSWQTVVVGDPLCAPLRQKPLAAHDIDPGVDDTTELPSFLSARRVKDLTSTGVKVAAAKLFVKSEMRITKEDRRGAREALEEATNIDESFAAAHLALAGLYEGSEQWDAAIDRYRRVIARVGNQVIALNNLAYALAAHKNAAAEALPLAKRAYVVANGAATVADTLGWVYHLLGSDTEAEPLMAAAAAGLPQNPDVQLHAAVVLAATGKTALASHALDAATKLRPKLEDLEEVRQLRARLGLPRR